MEPTLYFYDLETSGRSPKTSRIMQFGGQRTTLDLKPIGEPTSLLIKLSKDVLVEPEAVLIHGITPQQTWADGLSEEEFIKFFQSEISLPSTIFVGYNSIRFDDEFMRYLFYRNLYDPYEWQWAEGRSRWDLLDVARMTRALRPDGMKWPVNSDGKATVSLEAMTNINNIKHESAHSALGDVLALIDLAILLKKNQPKLFDYLLNLRDKNQLSNFIASNKVFVYSSGKYPSEFEKTSIVVSLEEHPNTKGAFIVYDLRVDPDNLFGKSAAELAELWSQKYDQKAEYFPIKTLKTNRCPAVAPLSVMDEQSWHRIGVSESEIKVNHAKIKANSEFVNKVVEAVKLLDAKQTQMFKVASTTPDQQLYDGFFDQADKNLMQKVHNADPQKITELATRFKDARLKSLAPLFKARNFHKSLTEAELNSWNEHVKGSVIPKLGDFLNSISELSLRSTTKNQQYLLEELKLYAQLYVETD